MIPSNDITAAAFSNEDEKAIDKAVRRLPGYWTWEYDPNSPSPHVNIVAPWGGDTAFTISGQDSGYGLECWLTDPLRGHETNPASGHYANLAYLLRGIRAVVMGDEFDRENPEPAAEARLGDKRSTARGHRPAKQSPYELTDDECALIENTLAEWEDAGRCPFDGISGNGALFVAWDSRFPAFQIHRANGYLALQDNISVGAGLRIGGRYETVQGALEAARCVVFGDWDSKHPEVAAKVEAIRSQGLQQAA